MAQAIDALNNLIKEKLPAKTMPKHNILRALLGMKHSPAGKKHLAKKKKRTQATYFRGIKGLQRPTTETQLRKAKVDEGDIKKMVGAKNYVGP